MHFLARCQEPVEASLSTSLGRAQPGEASPTAVLLRGLNAAVTAANML